MLKLNANVLVQLVRTLTAYQMTAKQQKDPAIRIDDADAQLVERILVSCDDAHTFFWLPVTAKRRGRIAAAIQARCSYIELQSLLGTLSETVEDELADRLVMYVPPARAAYYMLDEKALGEGVITRFPQLGTDIDEGVKCIGTGRFTAAVFHMMRVMEAGLQELGRTLGVSLVTDRTWQTILNDVNKEIASLGQRKDPRAASMASVAANLYNVKLAWRNEVMHPKQTYTEEEATGLATAVKSFMVDLLTVI